MAYHFREIEARWQAYWDEHQTFRTPDISSRPKAYILDMFPYPSGAGLHVGHMEGYTATDILARYKRMRGYDVLHPMGWDAFGLPAERYAMQTNIHPRITTLQNIGTFRRQIRVLGLSYDWSREVDTTDPGYYRWTQWIFLKVYNSWYDARVGKARPIETLEEELSAFGTTRLAYSEILSAEDWKRMSAKGRHDVLARYRLAYVADVPVNWCEALGTVLANEEVDEWTEKGYTVERRPMRQWMMRITAYAERLLEDAKNLDWQASTIEQQRNWIGRSEGAWIDFPVKGQEHSIRVFTTRPDTIFGATYIVLAPEHPMVGMVTTEMHRKVVEEYQAKTKAKSDIERGIYAEKKGVFVGGMALNPATKQEIPIWVADHVMIGYGTGAIMAVPSHDSRDWEFANNNLIPKKVVVLPQISFLSVEFDPSSEDIAGVIEVRKKQVLDGNTCFDEAGICIDSSNDEVSLDGLPTSEAKVRIIRWLETKRIGKGAVQYKLRDWVFSRQRYWGEPIPILHLEDGTMKPLQEDALPLLLPDLEKFQPSGTTESPLALAADWVNVIDSETGLKGRRETNTMPQWAGSCWYYLRYLDPANNEEFCSRAKERSWMAVDLYIGGSEHAVLHLMYARFWHKVLYDLGHVSTTEPFLKLRHQGIILGEDSRKMSKARGNVVNPDDVVLQYGADATRLFEMFMGPFEEMKPWSIRGVEGVYRFLNRVWRLYVAENDKLDVSLVNADPSPRMEQVFHATVKKVTEDIESLRFNTAISQMMIFVNEMMKERFRSRTILEPFVLLLAPFAPHISEDLWHRLGHEDSLAYEPWPIYDERKIEQSSVEVVLQVNGRVRSKITVAVDTPDLDIEALCRADASVRKHIEGKTLVKAVVVRNKLVNLVVR